MDRSSPPSTPTDDQTLEDLIVLAAELADDEEAARVARIRGVTLGALRSARRLDRPAALTASPTP
jgi:hypothetical protein